MIFIKVDSEAVLQVEDKTRIDVSKTFVNSGAITDITIKPEASESAISVFSSDQSNWYLDWAYETDGVKTITVEATDGVTPKSKDVTIIVLTVEEDNLFSGDSDIFPLEPELKNYIRPGRNSYLDIHREAQTRILSYLDRKRIWNTDGTRITKDQILDLDEVKEWSKYLTLQVIFEDLAVSVGDIFKDKAAVYRELARINAERATLRIDTDGNDTIDVYDKIDIKSLRMINR